MPLERGDDRLTGLIAAAIVIGTIGLANLLPAAPGGPPSTQSLGDRDVLCAEWTDGCVVCQRTDSGPACSMPGIACTRGAEQCLKKIAP